MKKLFSILLVTSLIVTLGAPAAFANGIPAVAGIVRCSPNLIVTDVQVGGPGGTMDWSINPSDKIPCAQALAKAVSLAAGYCESLETILLNLVLNAGAIATNNGSQFHIYGVCGNDP